MKDGIFIKDKDSTPNRHDPTMAQLAPNVSKKPNLAVNPESFKQGELDFYEQGAKKSSQLVNPLLARVRITSYPLQQPTGEYPRLDSLLYLPKI
jgi:hypothetical protein